MYNQFCSINTIGQTDLAYLSVDDQFKIIWLICGKNAINIKHIYHPKRKYVWKRPMNVMKQNYLYIYIRSKRA